MTEDPQLSERLHGEGLSFRRGNWSTFGVQDLESIDAVVVGQNPEDHREETSGLGGLELWLETRRAHPDGRDLPLPDYEFRLLSVLARRSGCVATPERRIEIAKGPSERSFDRSIDVRVSRLRSKLSVHPRHPQLLKTVRGVGHVLVARTM